MKRLVVSALFLGALLAGGASLVISVQRPAPSLKASAELVEGSEDRDLLNRLAARKKVGFHIRKDPMGERVALDTPAGADVLELGHLVETEGFGVLAHESAAVRLYAAHHLLRTKKSKLALLVPLLADGTLVETGMYDDAATMASVRDVTTGLLCAYAEDKRVKKFLERAAADWTLLIARGELRSCLARHAAATLPVRLSDGR